MRADSSSQPKCFFVYKASAGSGKTFHLAVNYLQICLRNFGEDPFIFRRILAITFTNKAVSEMKSRILFFLRCLSLPEERLNDKERDWRLLLLPYFSDITPESELSRRADMVWKNILSDYSRFSVLTIDKFYQRVVQAFAFELRLPANHRLELDEDMFTRQMVDVLLSRLGYDDTLTDFVLEYLYHRLDGQQRWNPERDLAGIAKELFREEMMAFEQEMPVLTLEDYKNIIRKLKSEIHRMRETLGQTAGRVLSLLPPNVDPASDFAYGKTGFGAWLMQVADGDLEKAAEPNSRVRAAAEEGSWVAKKTAAEKAGAIEALAPQLQEAYWEILDFAQKNRSDYLWYAHVLKNIYPFALLGEFRIVAETIKERSRQLLIGETNRYIARVVGSEEVPFIYERLGEQYSFFFIDEFQDTSRLQWRNLLPLVGEGLSKESGVKGRSGQAFLFGDAKQAIYRFRSGDVRQFVHLSRLHTEPADMSAENILKAGFCEKPLEQNFRSKEEIVAFNNSYFQYVRQKAGVNSPIFKAYEALEQKMPSLKKRSVGGGVELRIVSQKTDYEEFVLRQVISVVEEALHDGYMYKDLAVLARSNSLASRVAVTLSQGGVPVISSESLLLSASPEVRFLLAAIRCVRMPQHEVVRAHMLAYLSRKHSQESPLEEILPAAKTFSAFSEQLALWGYQPDWNLLRRMNLYELFRALSDVFRLWRADPYLMAMGEVVWAYHEDADREDADFLDYWEEQQKHLSLSNPEGINAVQVMTIHKAKGLAFPVVIYPMKKHGNRMEKERHWVRMNPPFRAGDAELKVVPVNLSQDLLHTVYADIYEEERDLSELDRLNVDYVAFTRAEERLYLLAADEGKNGNDTKTFLQDNCGIAPAEGRFTVENQEETSYLCYHYPNAASFAPASVPEEKQSVPEAEFVCQAAGPLPPLAYAVPEEESGKEAALGTLVHRYLSRICRREDAERLREGLAKDGSLTPEERLFLEKLLVNLATRPEAGGLFGDADTLVRTEAEMLSPDGKKFRIDRLLVKGNEVRLFDYKTGQPHEAHHAQLQGYAHCLRQIGFTVTDARLVYINTETAELVISEVSW